MIVINARKVLLKRLIWRSKTKNLTHIIRFSFLSHDKSPTAYIMEDDASLDSVRKRSKQTRR